MKNFQKMYLLYYWIKRVKYLKTVYTYMKNYLNLVIIYKTNFWSNMLLIRTFYVYVTRTFNRERNCKGTKIIYYMCNKHQMFNFLPWYFFLGKFLPYYGIVWRNLRNLTKGNIRLCVWSLVKKYVLLISQLIVKINLITLSIINLKSYLIYDFLYRIIKLDWVYLFKINVCIYRHKDRQ